MDGGKSRGCNTSPVMANTSSLIACDGKYNDFHTSVDVKLGPPFFPCAPCVNTIPGMVERRIHASELEKLVGEPDSIVNETNEISVEDGAGKMVAKEEHIAFPGLSPLRGDVVGSSSSIGIGLEAEYASGAFDHGRDSSDCEKSLFVSSRFFVDSLVDSDGDLAKKGCGFCCPTISSECLVISRNSHKNQAEGSNHSSPVGESQSLNFDRCSENESCPETIIKGESQQPCSQIGQGLTLQYVRKQKQARQKVSCTSLHENDINHQELTEEESFPQADHEVSCSAQGSNSEPTYFSATERFISENPSHSSTLACCSSGVPETDIMRSNFDASKGSSTCCSSSICCEEAERVNVAFKKPVFLSVIKRSNPKRAASLRGSLPIANSNELTIIRKGRRKCRRKGRREEITSTLSLVINMFSDVKRKRRSSQRQARLSAWGNVEELFNIIKQYNESERNDSEPSVFEKRGSKKVKSGGNRRKRNPALKSEHSQFSSIKKASSSSKTVAPILFDAKASLKKNIGHLMPASDGHTSLGFSDSKFQFGQNLAEKCCGSSFRSIQRYGQRGDKDLNSTLTQETSVDTHQFDFHGVLSQFDPGHVAATIDAKLSFDSGTSPDSDVYNPPANVQSLSPEGSTAIKQDGGLDQKVIIEESKTEDGLLCSAVAYAGPVAESSSVLEKEIQVCESSSRRNSKSSQKGGKLKSGKKDGLMSKRIFPFSYHLSVEGGLDFLKKHSEVRKALVSSNCCQKDQPASRGVKCSKSVRKKYRRGSKSETIPLNSSLPSWDDLNCSGQFLEVQTNTGASTITLENVSNEQSGAIVTFGDVEGCQIPTSGDIKGCLISRSSKMSLNKGKSSRAHSANNKKKFSHLQTGKVRKSDNTKKAEPFFEENSSLVLSQEINSKLSVSGGELSADVGESTGISTVLKDASDCVATSVSSELSAREIYSSLLERPLLSSKKAWALCDDCQKWRCVPDELVHVIEKNRWTCRDNVDEAFADCAIPQEKTDEEINIDLGISDEYCFAGQPSYLQIEPQRTAARRTTWSLIKSNLYRHRNRRTQTIDEVMVCHCKQSHDGSLGCADECLNRVLNIECVKGTCPCGDLCSNQQFQKRKYAKFKWIHCGKKGYGLQLEEDVRQGQFLIEYVGEVLDIPAYEARLSDYASRGQKHFYFMTLNGGEVIDACGKGNLGRFINHSCDPNCRTEKWMVKGEVCIGLFAIRDIKKGEEVTFDYNYVRVFGAAVKKCVCGSAECRGYIGGDPSNSEVIVQDDSDEEDLGPIMIDEDGAIELGVLISDSNVPNTEAAKQENISVGRNEKQKKLSEQVSLTEKDAVHHLSSQMNLAENIKQSSDCIDSEFNMSKQSLEAQQLQDLKQGYSHMQPDETSSEPINDYPLFSTVSRPIDPMVLLERSKYDLTVDSTLHEKRSTSFTAEELPSVFKANISVKASRSVKIKRCRATLKNVTPQKTKKIPNAISTRHVEGVEERLNELLDEDGGISRQKKDAAKGYLKLLIVTAAAGNDIRSSMSQSARDLSMILDAILKTKSRNVLADIIKNNGLQMLHHMMKQNREKFNGIPILRKLLKVLEFLAENQILLQDHINSLPPYAGMESFKESMLNLVKHRDSQVQSIARSFTDQWMRRTVHRLEPSDKDNRLQSSKRACINLCPATNLKSWQDPPNWESDAVVCVSLATCPLTLPSNADKSREAFRLPSQQVSLSSSLPDNNSSMDYTRKRKRKSRWDQPADELEKPCSLFESTSIVEIPKPKSGTHSEGISSDEANAVKEFRQHNSNNDDEDDDDMPPGFGSLCVDNHPQVPGFSTDFDEVVVAHRQERYASHLRVSYGMPILLMEQLGIPDPGKSIRHNPSWAIAPAMPFKPFPPLPSSPRKETNTKTDGYEAFDGNVMTFPQNNQRLRCSHNDDSRKLFQKRHWNYQRSQRRWPDWPAWPNRPHERSAHKFEGKSRNGGPGSDA